MGLEFPDVGSGIDMPSMEDMLKIDPVMTTAEWLYDWQQSEEKKAWADTAAFWQDWERNQWSKGKSYADQIQGMLPADMSLEDLGATGLSFAQKVASGAAETAAGTAEDNMARYGKLVDTAFGAVDKVGGKLERSAAVQWMDTLDEIMPGASGMIKSSLSDVFASSKKSSAEAKKFLENYYPGSIAKQQELADLVAGRSKSYLTEGMPADLAKKIERQTLDKLSASGVATMSQKALSATAFTKGIGEMDFVDKGTALATSASDLYGKGINYARSAQALSADSAAQALAAIQAASGLVPRVDRGSMYNSAMTALSNSGLVNADTAYQLQMNAGLTGSAQAQSIATTNLEKAMQSVSAGLGYSSDVGGFTTNAMVGQYVARTADRAGQWDLFGQAWGGIFGMIGSIMGGKVGGGGA